MKLRFLHFTHGIVVIFALSQLMRCGFGNEKELLMDFSGGVVNLETSKAVSLFVSPFCATSNTYSKNFKALEDQFPQVKFYYFMSDPEIQDSDVGQWKEIFGVKGQILDDRNQNFAKKMSVMVTPTVIVFKNNTVIYRGAIDDYYVTPTRKKRKVEVEYLNEALKNSDKVEVLEREAIGCELKWK